MRRAIPILALCAAAAMPAAAQRDGEVPDRESGHLYARALLLESAEGNLDAAVEVYRVLVQQHQQSRVFAARAQLRLAACLEKLGNHDDARRAYELVVAQFADQAEPAQQARQALGRRGGAPREEERRDAALGASRDFDRRRKETARAVEELRARLEDLAATGDLRGAGPVERRLVALEKEQKELERVAESHRESAAVAAKLEQAGVPADVARLAVEASSEVREIRARAELLLAIVVDAARPDGGEPDERERAVADIEAAAEEMTAIATRRAAAAEQLCAEHLRLRAAEAKGGDAELPALRARLEDLKAVRLDEIRKLEVELRHRAESMNQLARRATGPRHRPAPGGPEGRGPEGRGPEGRGPEGRGPEGRGPEGPEGRGPEGRGPEGRGPEGRGPEGRGPEGRGPEGRGPEGRGPEGRGPEGRGPEGRGPEGRGPEGRGPEGRGPEGRGPEGRGPEGRGPEGGPSANDDAALRGELSRREARIHELEVMLEKMAKRLEDLERALSKGR